MAKGRRGRPKKARARSRATTRAGRAPPPDLGTAEVRRLRQLLNGRLDLPTDPLAALYSREFIDARAYAAGRYFAALVAITRNGWALRDGSVGYFWQRLTAGIVAETGTPAPTGLAAVSTADAARAKLSDMRAALLEADRGGAVLQAVMTVCVDGRWAGWVKNVLSRNPGLPTDWRSLNDLREGLWRLAELASHRIRPVAPVHAAAAE